MEYIIVILAIVAGCTGIAGALIPALPGPPLSFVGLLLLLLCDNNEIGIAPIVTAGVMAVVITILDYVAPLWLTKKKGGTKYGMWGAAIGMVAGIFAGPLGIVLCPFIGAFIGELMAKSPTDKALKTAFISFAAFMLTTGIKFVYSTSILIIIIVEGWKLLFTR